MLTIRATFPGCMALESVKIVVDNYCSVPIYNIISHYIPEFVYWFSVIHVIYVKYVSACYWEI